MKLTEEQLKRYVDQRYIERGQSYFEARLVVLDSIDANQVEASCVGNRVYQVSLTLNAGRLSGNCTCPAFEDFGPCKHIAATTFSVMAHNKGLYEPNPDAFDRIEELHIIKARLLEMEKSELINLLLQCTDEEELIWLLEE